ncbi:hypothetical protein VCV18_004689 [Metarhizium anisopliae]
MAVSGCGMTLPPIETQSWQRASTTRVCNCGHKTSLILDLKKEGLQLSKEIVTASLDNLPSERTAAAAVRSRIS